MEDQKIIDLLWSRSEDGIAQLQLRYGRLCSAIAGNILTDQRDVDECVADVYLRVWATIPPERPRSLQGYVARITRNLALDRYEYNHAEKRNSVMTLSFEEVEPFLGHALESPEEQAVAEAFRSVLNGFLHRQPKEKRIMFVRRYFYGDTPAQVAEYCGCTEGKVRTTLFRLRKQLRTALQKEGL